MKQIFSNIAKHLFEETDSLRRQKRDYKQFPSAKIQIIFRGNKSATKYCTSTRNKTSCQQRQFYPKFKERSLRCWCFEETYVLVTMGRHPVIYRTVQAFKSRGEKESERLVKKAAAAASG